MSASDAIPARVCHAADRSANLDSGIPPSYCVANVVHAWPWTVADRGREEPMQQLEQRTAWDGKIFLDGEFRSPDGGGTLTVLDKAAGEPIATVGTASA